MKKMAQIRALITIGVVWAAFLPLSACLQQGKAKTPPPQEDTQEVEKIRESELRAYCPQVTLPDSAAFYNVYENGGEGDATRILYQVVIDKTTRSCRYGEGQMTMQVAVAGRLVPGPKFNSAALSLPLYVEVKRHDEVLYHKQHGHSLTPNSQTVATQFIFKDEAVTFPQPTARNIRVAVGFDRPNKRPNKR